MNIKKTELNPAVRRAIKRKEQKLNRICRKIWVQENKKGEEYLYGNFCKNRQGLTVTIAVRNWSVIGGWLPQFE
jgi:hypothetical protein